MGDGAVRLCCAGERHRDTYHHGVAPGPHAPGPFLSISGCRVHPADQRAAAALMVSRRSVERRTGVALDEALSRRDFLARLGAAAGAVMVGCSETAPLGLPDPAKS